MSYPRAGRIQVYKIGINDREWIPPGYSLCALSLLPPWFSLLRKSDNPAFLKRLPENSVLKDKRGVIKVCCDCTALLTKSLLRLRLCPWYFECVTVCTRHECCLSRAGAEAGLLVALLACLVILLRGAPDSLDGVRGCCHRIGGLYFRREGRRMLLRLERAFCVSIDCYNPTRFWHLELEVCIVWYRIESSKCGSSKQCMITATERDDIEH